MDINEIKAGEYQLTAARWDQPTNKPGEPFTFTRHRRGDTVRLTESQAKRLVTVGAAVLPGSLEKAAAEKQAAHLKALLTQVPDDLREQLIASLSDAPENETEPVPPAPTPAGPPARPSDRASKAVWVDYAVSQGEDRAEAEKLGRDDLAAKFPVE